jgi:hypothetical protein
LTYFQAQYASFKKIADLSPSSRIKKNNRTLVHILSHGGARGVCNVLPTVKKPPDDVIEKSASHTAEFAVGENWIDMCTTERNLKRRIWKLRTAHSCTS